MLTERQYKSLCQYRDSAVPVPGEVDDLAEYFFEQKLIQIKKTEYSVRDECEVFYAKASWALTTKGKLALEEFEGHQAQVRENRTWQTASITIGLLTLAATILFGILALLR